ncbi:MAG: hypothetical protein JWM99_1049, partial [Verrucomicrobiales bacterium]|nr:hypothetical protein [Verrucomicrobiales bacterium]
IVFFCISLGFMVLLDRPLSPFIALYRP